MVAAPSELGPFSIEALRVEMDDMIAWSNKLRSELDLNYADHYERMDRLVAAQWELSVKYDVLQSKFDHFVDKHWRPMQHLACDVVSCLAVFTGESSVDLPFDLRTGGEPGAPLPASSTGLHYPSPESIVGGGVPSIPSHFFSDTGVGLDSLESLPSFISQSSGSSVPPPPLSASSWDEIEPHFIYSQLDTGRRQLSQGEFLALFSTPEGNSPELGTTVTYGVSVDVPGAGEGVRDGGGPGGV